ncbi:alpha/beta hydrolase [Neobacillus mesonae]|uniref:alpha/beta hydrolase n=1 Tax=Neobacillus mesonae TaxID=1193713 RepID=UPI001F2864B6|nr:alpha/beta hydrolase [Neobacillus mesonae]
MIVLKRRFWLLALIVFMAGMYFYQPAKGKEFREMDVTYGEEPRQKLDVYAPNDGGSKLHPVIVYVHGGGWMRGDKSNVGDKPAFFTNKGYVFVSVNYRLSPKATYDEMANDVSTAVKWVYEHAEQYHIDTSKINLMGHSAGGHLVTLIGTNPKYLMQAGLSLGMVNSVVNLDGPINLVEYIPKNERYKKIFGQDRQVWAEASPVSYASGQHLPPTMLIGPKRKATASFVKLANISGNKTRTFETHTLTHREITKLLGAASEGSPVASLKEAQNMTIAVEEFLNTYNIEN